MNFMSDYLKTKEKILDNLEKNSNLYLAPSKVCKGVGVFALKKIEKNSILFEDVPKNNYYFKWDELNNLDEKVLVKLKSLCNYHEDGIYVPSSLNNFNFSFFVNHSENNGNVYHDFFDDNYITLREIRPNEEILCTYLEEEIDWK